MKERILKFIEYKDLTNAAFEKEAGLSNGFINNMTDNIRDTSIRKVSETYPELDVDWWKTGKGQMIKNDQKIENNGNGNNNINNNGGNIAISHNDFSSMIELQKGYQNLQKELTERLKTSQNQLSESQKQINTLLEILKTK